MSNRHLSRTLALQALYEWDFLHAPDESIPTSLHYIRTEFAPQFEDEGFVQGLIDGVIKHKKDIDNTIVTFAPDWPIEQISTVDRNILRLGLYELLYDESIPAKVALNEAIELAKGFGGQASSRFVNGILGAVYKDNVKRGIVKDVDKPNT